MLPSKTSDNANYRDLACMHGSDTPAAVDAEGHRILLEKEVVLVEALNLAALETPKFTLIALPLKLNLSDGSPVRALAVVET